MNCRSKRRFSPGFAHASTLATVAFLLFSAATVRAQQKAGAPAAVAPAGNAEKGKIAFKKNGCFACHGDSGEGGISPYPTQAGFRTPRPVVTGAHLAEMPLPFQTFMSYVRKPAGRMPAFGNNISEADLADIYAFLKSVPPSPDPKSTPLLNGQ